MPWRIFCMVYLVKASKPNALLIRTCLQPQDYFALCRGNAMATTTPKELLFFCVHKYICTPLIPHQGIRKSRAVSTKKPKTMSSNGTDKKGQRAQKEKTIALDKQIENIINQDFDILKSLNNSTDFYHAIYKIIETLNEKQGAFQVKLPEKEELEKQYKRHVHGNKMEKENFRQLMKEIITFEKFSIGKSALDTIFFIFGVPIGSVFLKRFIPGGESISDNIFLPAVTSLTVLGLAKANRL